MGESYLKYVPCLRIEDLPKPGFATACYAAGLSICIAVDHKGDVYALGDKCPPLGQPLSVGRVNNDGTIQGRFPGTKFSLKTGGVVDWGPSGVGKVIGGFSETKVPVYKVKKGDKTIDVEVNVDLQANFEAEYWARVLGAQGEANGGGYY